MAQASQGPLSGIAVFVFVGIGVGDNLILVGTRVAVGSDTAYTKAVIVKSFACWFEMD